MCHKKTLLKNIFSGPFLSITDATLFMSNQILKRFIKKYIDFHQKFLVEKYFCDRKFSKSEIFDHNFWKSENRKVKNVNNLRYENFEIFRFWKFSIMIFSFSKKKVKKYCDFFPGSIFTMRPRESVEKRILQLKMAFLRISENISFFLTEKYLMYPK